MNIEELFKGVVVIIDDEHNIQEANINKIISQIEKKKFPVLKYKSLENIDVKKLGFISFLLLDWDLGSSILEEQEKISGVKIPSQRDTNITENINFVTAVRFSTVKKEKACISLIEMV